MLFTVCVVEYLQRPLFSLATPCFREESGQGISQLMCVTLHVGLKQSRLALYREITVDREQCDDFQDDHDNQFGSKSHGINE